jgi:hypothetical protein
LSSPPRGAGVGPDLEQDLELASVARFAAG